MSQPRIKANWVNVKDRLPDHETYGPYPRVMVATAYHDHPDWGYGQRLAELRYINGDRSRPLWVSADKAVAPIETTAYGVMWWADVPEDPPPFATNEE